MFLSAAPCCLYKPTDKSFNHADLRKWLTSVWCDPELSYTYVTPDDGTTMFRASSIFQADSTFANLSRSKPKQIRTNNSPCYDCVPLFLKKFKPSALSSFTIHVSRISSMGSATELECMAKLVANKIKVVSIDWEKFANSMTKVCKEEVMNTLNNNEKFKEAQKVLNEQILKINKWSKSSNVSQFCI